MRAHAHPFGLGIWFVQGCCLLFCIGGLQGQLLLTNTKPCRGPTVEYRMLNVDIESSIPSAAVPLPRCPVHLWQDVVRTWTLHHVVSEGTCRYLWIPSVSVGSDVVGWMRRMSALILAHFKSHWPLSSLLLTGPSRVWWTLRCTLRKL